MGERGPELNPVQDLLRALDEAGDGLTARNVWLTLHPTLRKIPDLGARVDWSRVAFGTFTPGESRQLSIRLGMTTFPQRMVMGQPLAFMDQLRLPGVRLHYQSERQYDLIDFRYNALDGTEETTDVLDEFDEMYPARRSRIRFLIAGNPLALETQDQDVGSTIFERRHLDIIQADRRSQPYIYEPPINTNQTIGYGGAVWEGTDARRANPYGGTLNDGGLDTLVN